MLVSRTPDLQNSPFIKNIDYWIDNDGTSNFEVQFNIKNYNMMDIVKFCNNNPDFWYDIRHKILFYKTHTSTTIPDCLSKIKNATLL